MNYENKDLIYKIQENTIKRRHKAKILQKLFFLNSIERVFYLIRFINKKYIRFNPSRNYLKKSLNKEELTVELSLNIVFKVFENLFNYCVLQVGIEWKIKKAVRKNSNKIYSNSFYYKLLIFGRGMGI